MPTDLPCRWGQRLFSFFEMARLILYAFSLETHCFLKINSVNDLITTWSGPDLLVKAPAPEEFSDFFWS